MELEIRLVRDVPSDQMMQLQWIQTAIPWCTTHDAQQSGDQPYCKDARAPDTDAEIHKCTFSTGGSDHKWWKDNGTRS